MLSQMILQPGAVNEGCNYWTLQSTVQKRADEWEDHKLGDESFVRNYKELFFKSALKEFDYRSLNQQVTRMILKEIRKLRLELANM